MTINGPGDIWNYIFYAFTFLGQLIETQVLPLAPDWLGYIVYALIRMALILGFLIPMVLVFIYVERRLVARFQVRKGPNRVGPFGLFQGFADVLKLMTKEIIRPREADRMLHMLAPIVAVLPSIIAFAVIPFAPGAALANINVAVLYIMAVSTAGILSVLMACYASNNKYSIMGGMRMVAMIISYELPLVLILLAVVALTQTMNLNGIVEWQRNNGWLVLYQPLALVIFFICALAELGRAPFDLTEGESEITAGYHSEYGGMGFAFIFLREYFDAILLSMLAAIIFLGGWDTSFFGIRPGGFDLFGFIPPYVILVIKTFFVFFFMLWGRATLPRMRIDHVLTFGWKFLVPLTLVNLLLMAIFILASQDQPIVLFVLSLVNSAVALGMLVLWQNRMIGRRWALQPMT